MAYYCGYNVWSVDFGCIVYRFFASVKVFVSLLYDIKGYTIL